MNDDQIRTIATQLALAFNAPVEKAVIEENLHSSPFGHIYPRFMEHVSPRTEDEIAESETMVPFVSPSGLVQERPLTFMEILEKMVDMGFIIEEKTS